MEIYRNILLTNFFKIYCEKLTNQNLKSYEKK